MGADSKPDYFRKLHDANDATIEIYSDNDSTTLSSVNTIPDSLILRSSLFRLVNENLRIIYNNMMGLVLSAQDLLGPVSSMFTVFKMF